MDSSLAIEALNSDDYYVQRPNTGTKIRGKKQFTTSTPIEPLTCLSSTTPLFGTPQNIFSTFQAASPLQVRTPTGIPKSSSSPFQFTSLGKILALSKFGKKSRISSGHELVQWNSRMIQSLSSEDKADDVIILDDDDQQGGNSDSGFIIETTHSSTSHIGGSHKASLNFDEGIETSGIHPLTGETDSEDTNEQEALYHDDGNDNSNDISSDLEHQLLDNKGRDEDVNTALHITPTDGSPKPENITINVNLTSTGQQISMERPTELDVVKGETCSNIAAEKDRDEKAKSSSAITVKQPSTEKSEDILDAKDRKDKHGGKDVFISDKVCTKGTSGNEAKGKTDGKEITKQTAGKEATE